MFRNKVMKLSSSASSEKNVLVTFLSVHVYIIPGLHPRLIFNKLFNLSVREFEIVADGKEKKLKKSRRVELSLKKNKENIFFKLNLVKTVFSLNWARTK